MDVRNHAAFPRRLIEHPTCVLDGCITLPKCSRAFVSTKPHEIQAVMNLRHNRGSFSGKIFTRGRGFHTSEQGIVFGDGSNAGRTRGTHIPASAAPVSCRSIQGRRRKFSTCIARTIFSEVCDVARPDPSPRQNPGSLQKLFGGRRSGATCTREASARKALITRCF